MLSQDKWQRVGFKKRSGVFVPLFSVYSKHSLGIGDFDDLKILVDWAHNTGNSILQLLPMNELGPVSCPYDSISSFALEPAYISLRSVPGINQAIKEKIEVVRKIFPCGFGNVDYRIKEVKVNILREIFLNADLENKDFNKFTEDNSYWLDDFALFAVLKMRNKAAAWFDWEDKYKNRLQSALHEFVCENKQEIIFHKWLQWLIAKQFSEVKQYANSKNIFLKGDLPILVSRDSADVWVNPQFFKLGFAAGAPPDMYCAKGQRWGMPTYDWEKIAEDEHYYLKEKLKYAQNFYDILRVDHVVGLFRIWSIPYNDPTENQGLHGVFDPCDEHRWGEHGWSILSAMLNNTDMLLCAEDLGIIPRVCIDALKELGIPGNDVQRWVKDWNVRHDFLAPGEYREFSVAMLSTHDTTNWPAWWENEAGTVDEALFIRKCNERGIDFLKVSPELFDVALSCHGRLRWKDNIDSVDKLISILGKKKEEVGDFIDLYLNSYQEKEKLWQHFGFAGPLREKCDSGITYQALKVVLDSKAIFSINNIIDWLYLSDVLKGDPYQYRINTPGTVSPNNWSLTLPIPLEDLVHHKINPEIRKMISASGRV